MRRIAIPALLAISALAGAGRAEVRGDPDDPRPKKAYVICFDFASAEAGYGEAMADTIRLKLARHEEYFVLDRITSQEGAPPQGADADPKTVEKFMDQLGLNVGLYGTVAKRGDTVTVEVRCIDRTNPDKPVTWKETYTDATQRWRAEIARPVIEKITGLPEWVPPQYGDEVEPKNLNKAEAVNRNGDFEKGWLGWTHPDNVSTFVEKGPAGHGNILRVQTDLARDPWLEYTRKLRFGQADPDHPPQIAKDTSYGCVGGLEGVHFRSEWLPAVTGQRYWVVADAAKPGGTPKVFIKGFLNRAELIGADGLPEESLYQLGLTAQSFAAMPEEKRKALVAEDVKKHPERYRQECYRWYLNLREGGKDQWQHHAAVCPPRGGLPANVEHIRVEIYSYWPPGQYLWDNVWMYKDPTQKAPAAEEEARTKNLHKKELLHDAERKGAAASQPAETKKDSASKGRAGK